MTVNRIFQIKAHDDYHEIEPPKGWRAIELGCFIPVGYGYARYFGLYYKGHRPRAELVMRSLKRTLYFDDDQTLEVVEYEVKEALKVK